MELIEVILSKENLNRAYQKVVAKKGAGGIDGITVEELGDYIRENKDMIVTSIRNRTYMPKPVRRVYIPKENGKQRPLGIPTALDRTIQNLIQSGNGLSPLHQSKSSHPSTALSGNQIHRNNQ